MEIENTFLIFPLTILSLVLILASSCKKETDLEQPPALTTGDVHSVTTTSANCGGHIASDGGAAVTARGVCWSTAHEPTTADSKTTDGNGTGNFTSAITGLAATTTYFVRAYATNSVTTSYGNEMSFKTYTGIITDVEDNAYYTITIGTQTWMAENLRTTKYSDQTPIPLVADVPEWASLSTPGYCWYRNDEAAFKTAFGALYNWYALDAATNGNKNVCPAGWHVPSDEEWNTLITFLGGDRVAGAKMKETGTANWQSPNAGATNESGFTALPGGGRYYEGTFSSIDSTGGWWSSTELLPATARGRYLYYNYSLIYRGSGSKRDGFSVRCLKD
jgi:uncharacterized protein (TIGR02145 family)